jgi:opacity protein-like surface antigen
VVAGIGGTGAVRGTPNNGGASLALSLLWPLEDHFDAGLMTFVDDLGQTTGRLVVDGTDLGPVAERHRQAVGVAWRIEGRLYGKHYEPSAALTWGVYRSTDDVRGSRLGSRTSAGFGLGAGLARRLSDRHAAGLFVRYQQLSRGATHGYLSAAFEWRWRTGRAHRP